MAARPVEIDGRVIRAELSRTSYTVESGAHRIMLTPSGWKPPVEGEQAPLVTVSIGVEPGARHFIAMRKAGDGTWEAVNWKTETL